MIKRLSITVIQRMWANRTFTLWMPIIFQILTRAVDLLAISFVEREAIFFSYRSEFLIIQYLIDWTWPLLICVGLAFILWQVSKKRWSYIGLFLMALLTLVITHAGLDQCDDYVTYQLEMINFAHNKRAYWQDIENSTDPQSPAFNSYTFADREINPGRKEKLLVWDLDRGHPGIWLLVYDESNEVANPGTDQRYIGQFCGTVTHDKKISCFTGNDRRHSVLSGAAPFKVVGLEPHFFLVNIDDPNAH